MLFNSEHRNIRKLRESLYTSLLGIIAIILLFAIGLLFYGVMGDSLAMDFSKPTPNESTYKRSAQKRNVEDLVENGIHVKTGLVVAEGFEEVKATCTACHSAKLVTQNRASREGWKAMITWMQETQGLWQLGRAEDKILNYLAANYAPEEIGRRANLEVQEWYELD